MKDKNLFRLYEKELKNNPELERILKHFDIDKNQYFEFLIEKSSQIKIEQSTSNSTNF